MTSNNLDNFTLHISKLAALQFLNKNQNEEIILRKLCWKKVGQRCVPVQTEIDLTRDEIELLIETAKLLEYFVAISQQSNKTPTPEPPPRSTL